VRALTFGEESQHVRHIGGYMSFFTVPAEIELDGWFLMYSAPGGRVVATRPDRDPASAKAILSFAAPPLAYDRHDVDAQKRMLAERFAGAGWETQRFLDAMWDSPDFYLDAVAQVRMERYTAGRVALVGDAGYSPSPLTGLGTCLAMVGAYVLAGELALADGDHEVAFPRYQELMRPYVAQCQQLPPGGFRGFAPNSALALWLRTQTMRLMVARPFRSLLAKAMLPKADGLDLPDYGF
jgi:2-polyprenyl-6-methoxyphenol hydroxylase-like FAD-dependent oxidoreductase